MAWILGLRNLKCRKNTRFYLMGYIMSIIKQDKLKWGLFFLLCFGLLFAVTLLLSQEQQSLPDKIDFPLQTITPLEL